MRSRLALCALLLSSAGSLSAAVDTPAGPSHWVQVGPGGRLRYTTTPRGDRIADFSYAGYRGGGVPLPNAVVAASLAPSGGDDTAAMQTALDALGARANASADTALNTPMALQLAPGTFHLSQTVYLSISGIVLRGSGVGQTVLALTGKPHLGVALAPHGAAHPPAEEDIATPASAQGSGPAPQAGTTLAPDRYQPSGVREIVVASSAGFHPGEVIQLIKPATPAWVDFMGMSRLSRPGRDEHWVGPELRVERRVVAVNGNNLTLDVPLTDSYDPKFGGGAATQVLHAQPGPHLQEVGVEALTVTAPALLADLSSPHFDALQIGAAEDSWVREVNITDTTSGITLLAGSRRITIDRVNMVQHNPVTSSAKPFGFSIAGTQELIMRSSVVANKLFFAATQAEQQGPNVILMCAFKGDTALEPHQRWGTGLLVDNVEVREGAINYMNRGTMGTGHGWTMGWGVVWNSSADSLTVQSPPGAVNWLIGSSGERVGKPMPLSDHGGNKGPNLPNGVDDSAGHRVLPQSLYLQQLAERLGVNAVRAIGF